MKLPLLPLLTFLSPLALCQQINQTCPTSQPVLVAYSNGIRRTYSQALKVDLAHLQDKVTAALPSDGIDPNQLSFCLVYDSTYVESESTNLNLIGDSIDAPSQIFQGFLQIELQEPQQFWYWWSNNPSVPSWFDQLEQKVGTAIGTGISTVLQPDIFKQEDLYKTALANNQTVIVVAHSQGNLYANQAYDLLFPSSSSPGIQRFKIVSVATPADHVAGNGPYTTLLRDPIYLTGTLAEAVSVAIHGPPVSPSLNWNVDNGPCVEDTCYEWSGTPTNFVFHDFATSYLDGSVSSAKILKDIVAAIPRVPIGGIGSFDAGNWTGNNYVYTWLAFSPILSGTLTSVTSQTFLCANGNCNGPAYYVICAIDAGQYNACPGGSLIAISDATYGYSDSPQSSTQQFTFSGTNQAQLIAGQTYYVRPFICSYGIGFCNGGQVLAGGVQTFFGIATPGVNITEHSVPTADAAPFGITTGPDGALWFTESNSGKIGRITTSGSITEYALPGINSGPSPEPITITSGADGALWFTELQGNKIGRITTSGAVTEYELSAGGSPWGITAGSDGALWFTEEGTNKIGRISTLGVITEYPLPTGHVYPYGIISGPDGALWFTENASANIGRISTNGSITEYSLAGKTGNPTGITVGPDGALWFLATSGTGACCGSIGRITTTGVITNYIVSNFLKGNQITTGSDGALWFTDNYSGNLGRITTSGVAIEYPVPTPNSDLRGITLGPDGAIWFVESGSNKIGRAALSGTSP